MYRGDRAGDPEVRSYSGTLRSTRTVFTRPYTHTPLIPETLGDGPDLLRVSLLPILPVLTPSPFCVRTRGLKGSFANVGSLGLGREQEATGKGQLEGRVVRGGAKGVPDTPFWRSREEMNPKAEGLCASP